MQENQFEKAPIPDQTEKSKKEKLETLHQICLKICDYFGIYETSYIQLMEDTEFGFSVEECDAIDFILSRLPEVIHDEITRNPDVIFAKDSNISHVIGNSPLAQQRTVERKIEKKIEKLQNRKRPIIPGNDDAQETIDLSRSKTGISSREEIDYINYWIDKLELTPEEKQVFLSFKKSRALLLYYLDLIEEPGNKNILLAEMASADGWLETLKHYYMEETRLPGESDSRFQHINFFARLNGLRSNLPKMIPAFSGISAPITEENFQEEFDKLKDKDFLNKELIQKEFFPESSRMAA